MTTFGVQGFGLRSSIYEVLKKYDTVSIPGCEDSGFTCQILGSGFGISANQEAAQHGRAAAREGSPSTVPRLGNISAGGERRPHQRFNQVQPL